MKHTCTILICAVFFLGLASGCAQPPTEEMDNAAEAVARAENDIDAVTYAGSTLARARNALAEMHNEAAAKRYDAARSYAAEAISAAERAISEGRTGAARAREEAASLVSELPPLVTETAQGITAARTNGLSLDYQQVNRDFDTARNNVEQAGDALSDTRYQDALRLGRTARSELTQINQLIAQAAMAASRAK